MEFVLFDLHAGWVPPVVDVESGGGEDDDNDEEDGHDHSGLARLAKGEHAAHLQRINSVKMTEQRLRNCISGIYVPRSRSACRSSRCRTRSAYPPTRRTRHRSGTCRSAAAPVDGFGLRAENYHISPLINHHMKFSGSVHWATKAKQIVDIFYLLKNWAN